MQTLKGVSLALGPLALFLAIAVAMAGEPVDWDARHSEKYGG